jgi:hypothetical protein
LVWEREREGESQMEKSESSASLRWKILRRSLRPPPSSLSGIYETVHYLFTTFTLWSFQSISQIDLLPELLFMFSGNDKVSISIFLNWTDQPCTDNVSRRASTGFNLIKFRVLDGQLAENLLVSSNGKDICVNYNLPIGNKQLNMV